MKIAQKNGSQWANKIKQLRLLAYCAFVVLLGLIGLQSGPAVAATSDLWGETGEAWSNSSRLPDFSFAGYRNGGVALPSPAVVKNVKLDFGAVGDGVANDTQAFINAIAATGDGALYVPPGRYKITRVLQIRKSNFVLRGAGPSQTTLFFPNSLTDVAGSDGLTGKWAFYGGLIWIEGSDTGTQVTSVSANAVRGSDMLSVASAASLAVGSSYRLVEIDDASHALAKHMEADLAGVGSDQFGYSSDMAAEDPKKIVDWTFKIKSISGNVITLDRPLRLDVKSEWQPKIYSHVSSVKEVGIENLAIEFSGEAKKSHLQEEGYNAIHMAYVDDSWVKNVVIIDSDWGVNARRFVRRVTVDGLTIKAVKRTSAETCHHGVATTFLSQDNLFTNLRFDTQCVHDITVEGFANGNVFASSSGVKLNFDHHRAAPYENLFTDIRVGTASRVWSSGGNATRGPQSGARETFWNITGIGNFQGYTTAEWPMLNIIGMGTNYSTSKTSNQWVDAVSPAQLTPQNLYAAQLARRTNVYQAEEARLFGAVVASTRTGSRVVDYVGGGFADYVNASGDYVEWTVNVPATDTYSLQFRYANGGNTNRPLSISVNGNVVNTGAAFGPTGGWSSWSTVSVNASLPVGAAVKIRATSTGANGPNLDSLKIQ